MVREILVKVAERVITTLEVFFGKRDAAENLLLKLGEPVFRFVEGTDENVVISSDGIVLRRKCTRGGRRPYYEIVDCKPNNSGYLQVHLGKHLNTTTVHRLVAETFLERPEGTTEVDHINHDKLDNCVFNLRWVNHSENMYNVDYRGRSKNPWINIEATNTETGNTLTFKNVSELTSFAKDRKWGKGWWPRIISVMEKGGLAYGYFWKGEKKE